MKSIFLSPDEVFGQKLPLLETVGAAAPASDLALLTAEDDGFLVDGRCINYYLQTGVVSRFGTADPCAVCAVRPALQLDEGEEKLLSRRQNDGKVTVVEYGQYPYTVLDESMRALAQREYARHALNKTERTVYIAGEDHPVYRLGAKEIVCVKAVATQNGFVTLGDGTVAAEGEDVFLEMRPVRWLYDEERRLLISCMALFAGLGREEAEKYLRKKFPSELIVPEEKTDFTDFRMEKHDELSLIRAYVEADIPVFLHGLSGDGKSDRVRQIDPQALDIELVNETPETINGRAVYNETRSEIVDIKPV